MHAMKNLSVNAFRGGAFIFVSSGWCHWLRVTLSMEGPWCMRHWIPSTPAKGLFGEGSNSTGMKHHLVKIFYQKLSVLRTSVEELFGFFFQYQIFSLENETHLHNFSFKSFLLSLLKSFTSKGFIPLFYSIPTSSMKICVL